MPQNVFVLTGAGISAESGLGTFRDKDGQGIWARFDPMKLATPEAFARDPDNGARFLRPSPPQPSQRQSPTPPIGRWRGSSRRSTARGGHLTLVTQNIDDLHERAGSRRVIHMHGELLKARCSDCDTVRLWRGGSSPFRTSARIAARRAGFVRMWSGSAKCRCIWTTSTGRCAGPISSSPSAPRAPSIRRRASSPRRALMECGRARSTSRPPTTLTCSTSAAWAGERDGAGVGRGASRCAAVAVAWRAGAVGDRARPLTSPAPRRRSWRHRFGRPGRKIERSPDRGTTDVAPQFPWSGCCHDKASR